MGRTDGCRFSRDSPSCNLAIPGSPDLEEDRVLTGRTKIHIAVAVLLMTQCVLLVRSSLDDSATNDEGVHLAAGYTALRQRDFHLSPEHPPLARMLCALPLLLLHLSAPALDPQAATIDEERFGSQFLFGSNQPAQRILAAGRAVTIVLTVLFAGLVFLYTRNNFGPGPALLALALFALDPNLLAHGRLVTNDLLLALLFFGSCIAWEAYLKTESWSDLARVAVITGLAFATKFSALILPAIFLLLGWVIRRRLYWRALVVTIAGALMVVWVVYLGEIRSIQSDPKVMSHFSAFAPGLHWLSSIPLPAYSFWKGIYRILEYDRQPWPMFAAGSNYLTPPWFYPLVVFAVKTGTVLLCLLVAVAWKQHRRILLILPTLCYFAFGLVTSLHRGVRHLLPIYPFLIVLAAVGLFEFRRHSRFVAVAAILLVASEAILRFPSYISYFNLLAGGPGNGIYLLGDSDLDWGQDLTRLAHYLDERGDPPVRLYYSGTASGTAGPEAYGIRSTGSPDAPYTVVSAKLLQRQRQRFEQYWHRTPAAVIGYSLYVYQNRGSPIR
jgi:4-amino-4-deoxy-L-arabinose transferase-like glycosyltransferase